MYNFNWPHFVRVFTPNMLRNLKQIGWLEVLVSQVKVLHQAFLLWRDGIILKLSYTSQIIYLEKRLNDRWDATIRGIYIDNVADVSRKYLYNKNEQRPKTFIHNKWDSTATYMIGIWVVYLSRVWRSMDVSLNIPPGSFGSDWQNRRERDWFKNVAEYQAALDFIVYVPVAVVFDQNEMKAVINFYKLAGKRYTIQTY